MKYYIELTAITADGISGKPEYKNTYKVIAATEEEFSKKFDKIKRSFSLQNGVELDMIKVRIRKVDSSVTT